MFIAYHMVGKNIFLYLVVLLIFFLPMVGFYLVKAYYQYFVLKEKTIFLTIFLPNFRHNGAISDYVVLRYTIYTPNSLRYSIGKRQKVPLTLIDLIA